ncbi:E3 ubiquitin-protein ligase NHLRC1-like [Tachysurus vachellii]|uniref:E3 ubiquitin-protein ligase NHLRC1-like n=1 Tax=Tachysurus vachellii TaxID=175792 RepID=UPI00296AB87C|nr:E3 ubiquitin-protein ligase NHLRC1-like [Tachysurus vachellii]
MTPTRRAEEILDEIHTDLLECKVCFETFSSEPRTRRPRNLPCGHVICLGCVCSLSHAVSRHLECPFCRKQCGQGDTYECQVLVDLQEMIGLYFPQKKNKDCEKDLGSGVMRLDSAYGGWGPLINPTGVVVFGASQDVLVAHGGHQRVTGFGSRGQFLCSFGRYGHNSFEICHPLDLAVTPDGHVVVTDAGDRSVKVFSSTGNPVTTIPEFQLPWGVDVDISGTILVTDAETGTLWQIIMDFRHGVVSVKKAMVKDLKTPRAVACCRASGRIAVVEHLQIRESSGDDATLTRLKVFNSDFILLKQMDTLSFHPLKLSISAITFNRHGGLIVADVNQGLVWSLGDVQKAPELIPLVREGLVRPVGLVATDEDTLIVLDAGDHTVKTFTSNFEDLYSDNKL